MNLSKTKKILPLIAALAIILIILLGVVLVITTKKTTTTRPPGISSGSDTGYNQGFEQNYIKSLQSPDPLQTLADLRSNFPYQGKNFKFEYDYPTNRYIVTYKKGQESAGSSEFNSFLQKNGINQKDIVHLVTKSE